jgi:hypothetical protein
MKSVAWCAELDETAEIKLMITEFLYGNLLSPLSRVHFPC